MKVQFQIARMLQHPGVQLAGLCIMGFMTLRRSQKPDGKIYAFLFGLSLAIELAIF
jgi:hypothetical protein